jgi:hypothetical protein
MSAFSCSAVLEAAAYEKKTEQTKDRAAENKIGPAGSRSIEGRSNWKPPIAESQRGYRHAIDEFIEWYCSEPRLSFNRSVVLRYRIHLESRNLAPGTINVRLAAVRRLAYEASDAGLLSPELAAGIRRVNRLGRQND